MAGLFMFNLEGGGNSDSTPPAVSNVSPTPSTSIGANTPVTFDVTDDSGGLFTAWVSATIQGVAAPEVVHDGTSFTAPYAVDSVRTPITGGLRYSILRAGGWAGPFTITAYVKDAAGNEVA